MYEVQKYFTRINYTYDSFLVVANKDSYGKLSDKTKAMLQIIIGESFKQVNAQTVADEDKLMQQFRNEYGVEITELSKDQKQAFKDVLKPVIEKYKVKYGPEACTAFNVE